MLKERTIEKIAGVTAVIVLALLLLPIYCSAQSLLSQLSPDTTLKVVTLDNTSIIGLQDLGYIDEFDPITIAWEDAAQISGVVMDVNNVKWFVAAAIINYTYDGTFTSVNGLIINSDGSPPQIVFAYLNQTDSEVDQWQRCLAYKAQTGKASCP